MGDLGVCGLKPHELTREVSEMETTAVEEGKKKAPSMTVSQLLARLIKVAYLMKLRKRPGAQQ